MNRQALIQRLQERLSRISSPTLELFTDELIKQDIFPFYISEQDANRRFDELIKKTSPIYIGSATAPKVVRQQAITVDGLTFDHAVLTLIFYERAYQNYENLTTISGHESKLTVGCNLGWLYIEQKRYAEAEKLFCEAVEYYKKNPEYKKRDLIDIMQNLGYLYQLQGRLVEAEELWLKTLQLCRECRHLDESYVHANLKYLSNLYLLQHRYGYAEWLWLEALNTDINTHGEAYLTESKATVPLLEVYHKSLQHDKAEGFFARVLAAWQQKYGSLQTDDWHRAEMLGCLYAASGRLHEAKRYLEQALSLGKPILKYDSHAAIQSIKTELARVEALLQQQPNSKKMNLLALTPNDPYKTKSLDKDVQA